MGKKTEKPAVETAETMSEAAQAAEVKTEPVATVEQKAESGPCVYCGPTVRGVVKQYTVYCGGIPEVLEAFIKAHPAARALLVSVERFAETRRKMETAGTAEAILYQKIKSEL